MHVCYIYVYYMYVCKYTQKKQIFKYRFIYTYVYINAYMHICIHTFVYFTDMYINDCTHIY